MYKFIDHSRRPNFDLEIGIKEELDKAKDQARIVIILRGVLFFYAGQEITLGKLKEYFTDHAISKFVGDGFVKFK